MTPPSPPNYTLLPQAESPDGTDSQQPPRGLCHKFSRWKLSHKLTRQILLYCGISAVFIVSLHSLQINEDVSSSSSSATAADQLMIRVPLTQCGCQKLTRVGSPLPQKWPYTVKNTTCGQSAYARGPGQRVVGE